MNPSKRDYNGWILCPSTRFPGKFYYFNVVTGEAAWSLSDVERRMVSSHSFTNPDKWQAYPEPDSPPEETHLWNYQPEHRMFHQAMPTFGQAIFPKYGPHMAEPMCTNNGWTPLQIPTSMYRPMNVPTFEPMPQGWPNFSQSKLLYQDNTMKRDFPEPKFFDTNNRYFDMNNKFPNSNNQRQVFNQKPLKYPMNNPRSFMHPKDLFNVKSTMPYADQRMFNPPFRGQNEYFNENIFAQNSLASQELNRQRVLNQKFRNDSQFLGHSLSKSQENLSGFNGQNNFSNIQRQDQDFRPNPFKNTGLRLLRSKSMEMLNQTPKHVNPFLSPKKNITFPQLATQKFSNSRSFENLSNVHSTTEPTFSPEKKVQKTSVPLKPSVLRNRLVYVDNKANHEKEKGDNKEQNLNETDLRHVLMARRRKSVSDLQEDECNGVKKIKTKYSDDDTKPQPAKKKRVTFNLGVEGNSVVDEEIRDNMEVDTTADPNSIEMTENEPEAQAPVCVIADADVLLAEFDLIEEFVRSDESYTLLVPRSVKSEVEALGQGLCNGRLRVLSARHLVRRLADPPPHITVQPTDSPDKSEELTDSAILNCCLQVYDDGNYVILVTDNEELYKTATALEIETYTSQEIKEYMATPKIEVSFDLKKIANGLQSQDKHVENVKNSSIVNKDEKKNYKIDNQNYVFKTINFDNDNALNIQSKSINQSNGKAFFNENDVIMATQMSREIEKLNLKEIDEKNVSLKPRQEKQINKEKEVPSSSFKNENQDKEKVNFQNGDLSIGLVSFSNNAAQAMEESGAASKKKIKNINVYNLHEHIKSFYVKNSVVEERLAARMDEWVCLFSQIMEMILLDVLRTITTPQTEDCTNVPLRGVLQSVVDVYSDHRTVRTLIDKLTAALDYGYRNIGKNDHPTFSMKPSEFMQMFGYGILLIKCLRNIVPESPELAEGEELLENLQLDIEEGRAEPDMETPVVSRAALHGDREQCPRPDFVKKPSEVLQYLRKHYPEWNAYRTPEDIADDVQAQPETTKITRTFGKYLGSITLDTSKNMVLNQPNQNQKATDQKLFKEQNNNALKTKEFEEIPKLKPEEEITGPKLIKKLALHPFSQPKMKEIDIEKRETINKELLNMIENIIENKELPKSVTKFYDLDTIIVNKNNETCTKAIQINSGDARNRKDFLKNLEKITRTVHCSKLEETKNTNRNPIATEIKNTIQKNSNNKNEEQKGQEKTSSPKTVKKHEETPLDLDVLDYSDIQITPDDISEETLVIDTYNEATAANNDTFYEEDKNNDTQDKNNAGDQENAENDMQLKNDTGHNDVGNENDNQQNDNNEHNAGTDAEAESNVIDDSNDITDDSGIESESLQAYSFCQNFLCELSSTYKTVYYFIKTSISELKHNNKIRTSRKKMLHEKAVRTFSIMATIMRNLKLIIERESNEDTRIMQLLVKEGTEPAKDKRISRYRQVLIKCLEQARILQNALKLLQRITGDEDMDSISCGSMSLNEYYNVFE